MQGTAGAYLARAAPVQSPGAAVELPVGTGPLIDGRAALVADRVRSVGAGGRIVGAWVVGGVFALVGLFGVGLALRAFGKDATIRRWPQVPGTIISSHVESSEQSVKDANGYYRTSTWSHPEARYTYTVEGVEYEGTKIARAIATSNNSSSAKACVARYPQGAEVQVYCDPADPTTAYLETRRSIGGMILMGVSVPFLAIGLVLLGIALFG